MCNLCLEGSLKNRRPFLLILGLILLGISGYFLSPLGTTNFLNRLWERISNKYGLIALVLLIMAFCERKFKQLSKVGDIVLNAWANLYLLLTAGLVILLQFSINSPRIFCIIFWSMYFGLIISLVLLYLHESGIILMKFEFYKKINREGKKILKPKKKREEKRLLVCQISFLLLGLNGLFASPLIFKNIFAYLPLKTIMLFCIFTYWLAGMGHPLFRAPSRHFIRKHKIVSGASSVFVLPLSFLLVASFYDFMSKIVVLVFWIIYFSFIVVLILAYSHEQRNIKLKKRNLRTEP